MARTPEASTDGVRATARGGFTLVELLVVIAVISILMGVLLPSLSGAREAAQSLIGLNNHKQMVTAQSSYAADADGWFAGPNTSGARLILTNGEVAVGSSYSSMPTSTMDWISPTLGDPLGLSPNRAERTYEIFERLACPKANETAIIYNGSSPPDRSDFAEIALARGYRQISYLGNAGFLFAPTSGPAQQGVPWAPRALRNSGAGAVRGFTDPFTVPSGYRPRSDRIERPSAKVLTMDGTRYVEAFVSRGGSGTSLDFDSNVTPGIYGSFIGSPPPDHRSTSHGRAHLSNSDLNVDLSFRYYNREIHVGYFDGRAERLTAEEAWGEPERWYPTGSRYSGNRATPEIQETLDPGDELP